MDGQASGPLWPHTGMKLKRGLLQRFHLNEQQFRAKTREGYIRSALSASVKLNRVGLEGRPREDLKMSELELSKNLLAGIFAMNNQLADIDDSVFVQIIKAGIERAASGDVRVHAQLLEHAIALYTETWLQQAFEDDEDADLEMEKNEARETFMKY